MPVVVSDVQAVLGVNWDGVTDLSGWLSDSQAMVSYAAGKASTNNEDWPSALQDACTKNLAAHMYCMMDPMYRSRSTLSASGAPCQLSQSNLEYRNGAVSPLD